MNTRSLVGLILAVAAAVLVWWTQGDAGRTESDDSIVPPAPTASSLPQGSPPAITIPDASPPGTTVSAGTAGTTATTSAVVTTATSASDTAAVDTGTVDGLDTVNKTSLPSQAVETLALIDAGGPFPYDQDGGVFENRERMLPDRQSGYYREYTVDTPGSDDRGARRIVTGDGGEIYYTEDHYQSFWRVLR